MEVEGVVTPEGQSRIIMVTKKSWEKRGAIMMTKKTWERYHDNQEAPCSHAPSHSALLAGGRGLVCLTLDAQVHDVVPEAVIM